MRAFTFLVLLFLLPQRSAFCDGFAEIAADAVAKLPSEQITPLEALSKHGFAKDVNGLFAIPVGTCVTAAFESIEVSQIRNRNELIATFPAIRGDTYEVVIRGIDTSEMVDGRNYAFKGKVLFAERPTSYATVLGASKTVPSFLLLSTATQTAAKLKWAASRVRTFELDGGKEKITAALLKPTKKPNVVSIIVAGEDAQNVTLQRFSKADRDWIKALHAKDDEIAGMTEPKKRK